MTEERQEYVTGSLAGQINVTKYLSCFENFVAFIDINDRIQYN